MNFWAGLGNEWIRQPRSSILLVMDDALAYRWASRSRRIDLALFVSVLVLMILLSPRLRVYYAVTVFDISIEEIRPNGQRQSLDTPDEFVRLGAGYWKGDALVNRLTPRISEHMRRSDWPQNAPAGTRYEWTVRWSDNSTKLDRVDRIIWKDGQ